MSPCDIAVTISYFDVGKMHYTIIIYCTIIIIIIDMTIIVDSRTFFLQIDVKVDYFIRTSYIIRYVIQNQKIVPIFKNQDLAFYSINKYP